MPTTRVYVCVDAAHQSIELQSDNGTDAIEDAGLEIVSDITDDCAGDFSDILTLEQLLSSESNFVPHD
tara:strand:- start:1495 stop:1698 length:204 start_codon:yes stop_codon:yes gene_type:complete